MSDEAPVAEKPVEVVPPPMPPPPEPVAAPAPVTAPQAADVPAGPKKRNALVRGLAKCYYIAKFIVMIPVYMVKRRRTPDSMMLLSAPPSFFLWAFVALGFTLAWTVRLYPHAAGTCGWTFAWFVILFVITLLFDLNAKRLALWVLMFFAVWMSLKYAEDVKHWIVLGAITRHLASLDPKLDPGLAAVMSWVFLVPLVYALYYMFAFGMKRVTPNEIVEYHFMEGNELTDRQGLKFRTKYRDLLETILTFGGGDLVLTDNHDTEFKRYPIILFLFFLWPKMERIIEQRAVVEDSGGPADKR